MNLVTAQLPILDGLKDGWALSQTDLVRLARIEQVTMVQLLARMQRYGIVQRKRDPSEPGNNFVMLTEETRAEDAARS